MWFMSRSLMGGIWIEEDAMEMEALGVDADT